MTCLATHLTSFAVLVSIGDGPEKKVKQCVSILLCIFYYSGKWLCIVNNFIHWMCNISCVSLSIHNLTECDYYAVSVILINCFLLLCYTGKEIKSIIHLYT